MDDDLALLTIADVKVAVPAGNGIEAGLVVLREEEEPHREMRMIVGQPEARAIHVSWSNGVPPRPSTWDLFVSTISLLDASIDHVVITDVQEERHFFAQMVLRRTGVDDPLLLTARPSDAIALALRAWGAKIYARPHVLDDAGLLADGSNWVRPRPAPDTGAPEDVAPLGGEIRAGEDEALMGGWIGTPSEPSAAAPRRRAASRARSATSRTTKADAAKKPPSTKRTAVGTSAKKTSATRSAVTRTAGTKTAGTKTAGTKTAGTKTAGAKTAGTKTGTRAAASRTTAKRAATTAKTPVAKAASKRTTSRSSTSSTAVARTEAEAEAVEALTERPDVEAPTTVQEPTA